MRDKKSIRNIFDYTFLSFIVFAAFLGDKASIFLILFGLIPIFLYAKEIKNGIILKRRGLSIFIFFAYFFYGLLTLFFYRGIGPQQAAPVNPDVELYGVAILLFLLGLLRGALIDDLYLKQQRVLPWALLSTFLILTAYSVLDLSGTGRVQGFAAWPFVPALIFTTWSFLSLLGWGALTRLQRWSRLGLLSTSILVVNGYTGSRGIGVAQMVTVLALCAAGLFRKYKGGLPKFSELAIAVIAGICLLGIQQSATDRIAFLRIGYVTDFAFNLIATGSNKLASVATTSPRSTASTPPTLKGAAQSTQQIAPSAASRSAPSGTTAQALALSNVSQDASISVRLEMWSTSIKSFLRAPVFGHGSLSMKPIIQDRFGLQHNHNQYLTWMVTGGLILLVLGLAFLILPYFIAAELANSDRIIVTLAISLFWGCCMMFDSYFSLKFYLHYYCLMLGFLIALTRDMYMGRPTIGSAFEGPPVGRWLQDSESERESICLGPPSLHYSGES